MILQEINNKEFMTSNQSDKKCELYFDPCYDHVRLAGGLYTCDKCDFSVCTPPWNLKTATEEHEKRKSSSPNSNDWEKEIDKYIDEYGLYGDDLSKEELANSLYTEELWPENKYELSPDKVKQFIYNLLSSELQKEREKAYLEGLNAGIIDEQANWHIVLDDTKFATMMDDKDYGIDEVVKYIKKLESLTPPHHE